MSIPRRVRFIDQGIIADIDPDRGGVQGEFISLDDLLFFQVSSVESSWTQDLWRSDGTADGTYMLRSNARVGAKAGNVLLFTKSSHIAAPELWKTDGTLTGTSLIAEYRETQLWHIQFAYLIQNAIYFSGRPYGPGGEGLWSVDLDSGRVSHAVPRNIEIPKDIAVIGETFFFASRDNLFGGNVNIELWKSDGTEVGTAQVADIFPGNRTEESSNPRGLTVLGDNILFTANDGIHGFELWRSDGTAAGTAMVADINPGNESSGIFYGQQPIIKGSIYFSATDGSSGYELWKSDGTNEGTKRVADINPGPSGSGPRELTVVGETLFFVAFGTKGYGLWKSDGTTNGTKLVSDVGRYTYNIYRSEPRYLTAVGNSVFFTAIGDRNTGRELWKSDGTAAGTKMVADIFSGRQGSEPRDLKLVGNTLYFSAKSDDTTGRQLWALDVSDVFGDPNSGPASFEISGSLRSGNYLSASLKTSDPDGNGPFTYTWQTSSDGNTWANVGSNRPNYRISTSDSGKQLRLVVTYRDGKGIFETVTTAAGTVAYTPSHEILEILAKDVIYQTSHPLGSSVPEIAGLPYLINRIWDDSSTGLYALGLSAPDAPSVLIFRGTGDKLDIWDDLNPDGIGYDQFTSNYDEIRQWLFDQDSTFAPIITGHSLGGALAQWAAADATSNGSKRLAGVVTFNSPGIAADQSYQGKSIGANAFNSALVGDVTHYITSTDIVSLGGSRYIPGQFQLFNYGSLPDPGIGQHLNPVLVPQLPISGKDRAVDFTLTSKPF